MKVKAVCISIFAVIFLTAFDLSNFKLPQAVKDFLPLGTAVLGGVGCNRLYEGKNRAMVTALCAAGGAWLGTQIQAHLKEQEKAKVAEATYQTLETGRKQQITTEEGHTVTTELVTQPDLSATASAPPQPQGAPQVATTTEQECGTVKQVMVTKDNQRFEETVSACKKDGAWVVA